MTPPQSGHLSAALALDELLHTRAREAGAAATGVARPSRVGTLLRYGTVAGDAAAFFGALLVLGVQPQDAAPVLTLGWLAVLRAGGAYRRGLGYPLALELRTLTLASVFATLVLFQVGPSFGVTTAWSSTKALAIPLGFLLFARLVLRATSAVLRKRRALVRRVLLVGDGADAHELLENVAAWPGLGVEVVGVCADTTAGSVHSLPVLGLARSCARVAKDLGLRTVILASAALSPEECSKIHAELLRAEIEVVLAPTVAHVEAARLSTRQFGGLPVLRLQEREDRVRLLGKRVFDLVVATVLLAAFAPLFALAALAIRLDTRGPAFYRQVRVGRNGATFRVWKFRTMHVDADALIEDLRREHGNGDGGALFKLREDPRVTRVGRALRRMSLDELPQLLNVVAGQMSLVGPRPALPEEVAEFDDFTLRRLRVKPGITGLWQVSGRSDATFATYSRMDAFYAENWTLLGDMRILARTLPVVVRAKGAY